MDEQNASQGKPTKPKRYVLDDQTGKVFELQDETSLDFWTAVASTIYLLVMLVFFLWLLFDVWFGQFSLATIIGYKELGRLAASPTFHLLAYTIIGGALGGIVNSIRSILVWHSERQAFGVRFVWKYVTAPWLGATLALLVYALIRSGITVFGGDGSITSTTIVQSLATLGMGALAGYGWRQVFIWLDAQVNKIFKTTADETVVPDLSGKIRQDAEEILKTAKLKAGAVTEEATEDDNLLNLIIKQNPKAETNVAVGTAVDFTIAIKKA